MLQFDLDLDLPPVAAPRRRPRKRRRVNDARKRNQAMQHRLQTLMVAQWHRNDARPHPTVLAWLESDWFRTVCDFVGPVGAYALCALARSSKAATQAMWMADVDTMRTYGMGHENQQQPSLSFLPWYSVDGCKRMYVPKHYDAHPVPNVFRIAAPSRLCRVCYGAQSASTQIKLKVGAHFASGGRETVPVCEPCVGVLSAPAWTSVQVFCHKFDGAAQAALLEVLNMPVAPGQHCTKGPRRTSCGWPTVLLGPMCRAAKLCDARYAQLKSHMARTLEQARARKEEPGEARRQLLDCAVMWGGVSAEVRRGLR